MFGLNQQFTVCTEITFAIPSPRGIFQDNKVISFEQSKKKNQKNYKHLYFLKGDIDYCLQWCGPEYASFSWMNPCALAKKVLHFPFFLSCCIQPWHCIDLLYLFLGCVSWFQLCHLPHFWFCLPTSLSDIIQVRSGWEKTHNLESLVRYNSKNKSLRSEKNDRQLASYDLDCSPGVLPLFSMRSGLGTWLQ